MSLVIGRFTPQGKTPSAQDFSTPLKPIRSTSCAASMAQILRMIVLAALFVAGLLYLFHAGYAHAKGPPPDAGFAKFLQELWPDAKTQGVSRETFDDAFAGVTPDPSVIAITRKQAEFARPIWQYLGGAVTETRVHKGQEISAQWKSTLDKVEQRYGVDQNVVLGVWGMETNFGGAADTHYVIRSLASLAYVRYRGDFFRYELLIALKILQSGQLTKEEMRGSWAGAMGQPQFMPSTFIQYAVDFDGSGSKDIWSNVPDSLASMANYLKAHGWIAGEPWGFEVTLPQGFDASAFDESRYVPVGEFATKGVTQIDGAPLPAHGNYALMFPASSHGPAYLITRNFKVIKSYNNSLSYTLAVAILADRIAGKPGVQGAWPVHQPQLNEAQCFQMQRQLVRLGYNVGNVDGRVGDLMREAIRDFQRKRGLVADGYPTVALLDAMQKAR
ncbi:lytic murein transglycosylase [Methylovirgula sp. 4M-Z18]|uniref:lytic murein transglycosylase n=1 Tax=Methylovirgula sp. 4M-Z18 TaxID=2293567 RepID=UPI001314064F|nr:lytic murein transglycosylase [Methylovirgula sp. 4M-Z18]